MSHSSSVFNRVPIDLPNKSGFNLDHENLLTATCGTLVPVYCKPVLPNDTLSMGVNFQVQLPPFVTDFYGKVDACFEAFFVPNRILWAGWEDFITHPTSNPVYPSGTNVRNKPNRKPTIAIFNSNDTEYLKAGSLSDYLGFKKLNTYSIEGTRVDALPYFAYHMIYHHWYRDSRIQTPLFYPSANSQDTGSNPASLPYVSIASTGQVEGPTYSISAPLADGVSLGRLRQRNWSKGYFTTSSPYPQGGQAQEITFDVANDTGAISIAALRSANAIQQWKERNNFSYEYADQIYAQYGIYPDSAKMDKPIYLGRAVETVYSRSVMNTASSTLPNDDVNESSGFGVVNRLGGKAANGQALGEGRLFADFKPSEHGFLFVIFSLVPHSYYGTGIARHLYELDTEDVPFPLLAGMGDQPIYKFEITGEAPTGEIESEEIFGYTDRYAHYKYDEDEVHGLLRDSENLSSFALQRTFELNADVDLSSDFLQIPTSALDQVMQISTSTLGTTCWLDAFFKLSKVSTLPAYSLPTLGDIKNTHKGYVSRGGSRL